jgi:tetratricopeptide (TPR) repeat protein
MMLASMTLAAALTLAPPAQEPQKAAPAADPSASPAADHIKAGVAAYRKRHFQEAQRHFQSAVDADPSSPAANFSLGYVIYKIAEPKRPFHAEKQRAAELFAKAFELDPFFSPTW